MSLLLIFFRWVSVPASFGWLFYSGYDTDCTDILPVAAFFLCLPVSFLCWGLEAVRGLEAPEQPGMGLTRSS